MKDDLSSPSTVTRYSYKVYEDGPLTYYHYYFEETEVPVAPVESSSLVTYPKLLPAGLSAAGVLTAAFASGFTAVSVVNQPAPPPVTTSRPQNFPTRAQQAVSVKPAIVPEKSGMMPVSLRPAPKAKSAVKVSLKPATPPAQAKHLKSAALSAHRSTARPAIAAPESMPPSLQRVQSRPQRVSHSPKHSAPAPQVVAAAR
jgi:hypothetical protein